VDLTKKLIGALSQVHCAFFSFEVIDLLVDLW